MKWSLLYIATTLFNTAQAQCAGPVEQVLTCSSVVSGHIDPGTWTGIDPSPTGLCQPDFEYGADNHVGATCVEGNGPPFACNWECSGSNYECAVGTIPQDGPEDVYEFTCQQSGVVDIQITGMDCDLDIYVLDATCSPSGGGCEAGSIIGNTTNDSVSFTCTQGESYHVIVEGFGHTYQGYGYYQAVGGAGYCFPEDYPNHLGAYTLEFVPGNPATSGCVEICDDGIDNDGINGADCSDPLCTADPACNLPEICGNGTDDDNDGDTDCADSDCFGEPTCCDDDQDGFIDISCPTGPGGDCDDQSFDPPSSDTDSDLVVDTCDNCPDDANFSQTDTDNDGYGNACDLCSAFDDDADGDGDGSSCRDDCDDSDGNNFPGNLEVCDLADNDCDTVPDNGVTPNTYYRDSDGDNAGDPGDTVSVCGGAPSGYVADNTDCDDSDGNNYPGNAESCDGADNDCDTVADNGLTFVDSYPDVDGDGTGDGAAGISTCDGVPPGRITDDTDCDDNDANNFPGNPEVCDGADNNCNTTPDDGLTFVDSWADVDGDGFGDAGALSSTCDGIPSGNVTDDTDCNDADPNNFPGNAELCDGVDNNCNTTIDDGVVFVDSWPDTDSDGFGDEDVPPVSTCDGVPAGNVLDGTDCDDGDADNFPGNPELCDLQDNNCDSQIDEGVVDIDYWPDGDTDGFGDINATATSSCSGAPAGMVADGTDCDDGDPNNFPGNPEVCDGADNDCDGTADNGLTAVDYWPDGDGDGFGDMAVSPVSTCDGAPGGSVADGTDCDDGDPNNHPGNPELCDGADNDCDGVPDNGITQTTYWPDVDGDGFGDAAGTALQACDGAPAGTVLTNTDCNDTEATVNPGGIEAVYNGLDDDCDPATPDDDLDGDGFPLATDCDDTEPLVFPGAPELCNGVDDDCDGTIDNGVLTTPYYVDDDNDGYGDPNEPQVEVCGPPPPGLVDNALDCNDNDLDSSPDGFELPDGRDNDCDGTVDEGTTWYDDDGDGYTEVGGDCDDAMVAIRPGATEACDGVDDDCDGTVDENTACFDDDGDGFCEGPACADGSAPGDCNDGSADVHPAAAEIVDNGIDDDCDGSVDGELVDSDGDGYLDVGGDCDPDNANVYPGAPKLPDGVDNDCDGAIDEDTTASDDDGDGVTEQDGDCNDGNPDQAPGLPEVPNGIDDDCDGLVDDGTANADDDRDGYSEAAGDCDDDNAAVYPGAFEQDNGIDDDCDDRIDEGYGDLDGDGYTVEDGDCDDNNGFASPGVVEICDLIDNDCDGTADEGCGPDALEPVDSSCSCSDVGGGAGGLVTLLPLLILRRRRSS